MIKVTIEPPKERIVKIVMGEKEAGILCWMLGKTDLIIKERLYSKHTEEYNKEFSPDSFNELNDSINNIYNALSETLRGDE